MIKEIDWTPKKLEQIKKYILESNATDADKTYTTSLSAYAILKDIENNCTTNTNSIVQEIVSPENYMNFCSPVIKKGDQFYIEHSPYIEEDCKKLIPHITELCNLIMELNMIHHAGNQIDGVNVDEKEISNNIAVYKFSMISTNV